MKKIICWFLSAVITITMFSVLGVVSSAQGDDVAVYVTEGDGDGTLSGDSSSGDGGDAEGDSQTDGSLQEDEDSDGNGDLSGDLDDISVDSISFVPANESDYCFYPYSGGTWEWVQNEETAEYEFCFDYWWFNGVYSEGNKLVVTYSDGSSDEYVCDEDWWFVNAEGSELDASCLCDEYSYGEDGVLYLNVSYMGAECKYPVAFLESEIVSIEFSGDGPVLLDAYTDGCYDRLVAGENEGELIFSYNTLHTEDFGFDVTYSDGTQRTVCLNGDGDLVFADNGEDIGFLSLTEKSSQVYEEWLPGGSYTVTYYYEGVSFNVEYEVSSNDVVSVDYIQSGEAAELLYGVDGSFCQCAHEECAEFDNIYFNFDQTNVFPANGDMITVTYSDGTSQVFKWRGGWLYNEAENETLNHIICLYDDQDENHWGIGENSFSVRFFGYDDTVSVTVAEREVDCARIGSYDPVEIYENTNGFWSEDENGDETYIYYEPLYSEGVYIDIIFTDGSYDRYSFDEDYGWFVGDFGRTLPYGISVQDDQIIEQWDIGAHSFIVNIGDFVTEFTVIIVENPVSRIDFHIAETPVFKFEDENYGFRFNFGTEEDPNEVFVYYSEEYYAYSEGNSITVDYTDGTSVTYVYDRSQDDFVDGNGCCLWDGYYVSFYDCQDKCPWVPGSENNYIVAEFMGRRDAVSVVIDNGEKGSMAEIESISNSDRGVVINWDKVPEAKEYHIYRRLEGTDGKPSNNTWELIAKTNELTFTDSGDLEGGAYYRYIVHSWNDNGRSAYVSSMAVLNKYIPSVDNFYVTNTKSGVLFNWTRVEGYSIRFFRMEEGGDRWEYLGEMSSDASYVCNSDAVSGKTYMYAVAYYSNGYAGEIAYTDYITYLSQPQLKTIKNAVTGIYFNWTKVTGAVGYRVYRRGEGERNYTYIGTTENLWYCDSEVQYNNGKYYKYTVRAIAEDGSVSSFESGLVLKRLIIPYIRSLTNSTSGITVEWAEIPGAVSYRVYRRGAGQTTWTYLASVTELTYTDTGVKNSSGNYYRYTVKAVVDGAFTGYNPDGPYTIRLSTPALRGAVQVENGIQVAWNSVKGARGYQVYRRTADTTWVLVGTAKGTSYVDQTAVAGVEYTYTVRAYVGSYRSSYIYKGVSVALE